MVGGVVGVVALGDLKFLWQDAGGGSEVPTMSRMSRYSRQILLPEIGPAGQERLAMARVLLLGCGALGCTIADLLVRSGVGFVRIVDRDVVEDSNLQRQTLFSEADAREGLPKAVAAARRLQQVNREVTIEPHVVDVHSGNLPSLTEGTELLLDGTDNVATRYLINDLAVKLGLAWIYGACVGVEGRVMPILPGRGPCLRCVFPHPPRPGELPTCDTVGVLGPAAGVVASWQSAIALRLLVEGSAPLRLVRIDLWSQSVRTTDVGSARDPACPCCGLKSWEFLNRGYAGEVSLCGQRAVQVRPVASGRVDLSQLARRLAAVAEIQINEYVLRLQVNGLPFRITVFRDGRAIVQGTSDPVEARRLYDRFIGG
ncbi:MAG: ThiF family adenylyltransferase [Phycisphaerae bacterium]|nr:ThiF family adenylyltransferase [Phycisphaerae bacterium]